MSLAFVPNCLQVWVFGPGVGELIAVHVPPNGWLAIDGCGADGTLYGPKFFETVAKVRPTHVLFSHPHRDHASGVQQLVEWSTTGPKKEWPWLGAIPSPRPTGGRDDLIRVVEMAQARGALTLITRKWRENAAKRWFLHVGSKMKLGKGQVTVLSPDGDALIKARKRARSGSRVNWNRLACAVEVSWRGQRVVLGSDLENNGWASVFAKGAPPPNVGLKVAHHGSRGAQYELLLDRSRDAFLGT